MEILPIICKKINTLSKRKFKTQHNIWSSCGSHIIISMKMCGKISFPRFQGFQGRRESRYRDLTENLRKLEQVQTSVK